MGRALVPCEAARGGSPSPMRSATPVPTVAACLLWDQQPQCPLWQPVSRGIGSPGAHGGGPSPVGSAAPVPTVAIRLLWDCSSCCITHTAPWMVRGVGHVSCGQALHPLRSNQLDPLWHPRSAAPASLTAVQGAGDFPWLGRRGRRLAQAFAWQQQDLLGCSQGAPSPESGEERGAMMAEGLVQCWETEERGRALSSSFSAPGGLGASLGAQAHPTDHPEQGMELEPSRDPFPSRLWDTRIIGSAAARGG